MSRLVATAMRLSENTRAKEECRREDGEQVAKPSYLVSFPYDLFFFNVLF